MNIRVLLCTAGIAAVQVLSAIELTADSNRLEAGEAFVKNAGRVPRTGQGRNEMPVGFPRMQILSGATSRGVFYSGQFPYGYSLWSRGA